MPELVRSVAKLGYLWAVTVSGSVIQDACVDNRGCLWIINDSEFRSFLTITVEFFNLF